MAEEQTNAHDEDVQNQILRIQLKADLEKVIYEYGEKGMTCLDVIKVLSQLTTDMVDIIDKQGDDDLEEDIEPEEEQQE